MAPNMENPLTKAQIMTTPTPTLEQDQVLVELSQLLYQFFEAGRDCERSSMPAIVGESVGCDGSPTYEDFYTQNRARVMRLLQRLTSTY